MTSCIFIAILAALAMIDYSSFKIPNIIVLPAIGYGIYLTGNWPSAMIMFSGGALLYRQELWRGGDVKLMAMLGAFMGVTAIFVMPLIICLIYLFRRMRKYTKPLPVTPFSFVAVLPFVLWIR